MYENHWLVKWPPGRRRRRQDNIKMKTKQLRSELDSAGIEYSPITGLCEHGIWIPLNIRKLTFGFHNRQGIYGSTDSIWRWGQILCHVSYPHSVFMCFVWLSIQTAIISLHNINWLVCITETECVYCAVRTCLCVLCGSQNKQRLFHCTALTDWFV
jgi:hypothetical protein